MAEWTASYINDLPDSAFACIDPGGDKDETGRTVPRSKRHYPHHDAAGNVDLPHLRNALARVRQDATTTCGEGHLEDHAAAEEVGTKSSLLAIKSTGPDTVEGLAIPYGIDTDGEQFTADTDLCLDWFGKSGRPMLYEHGLDRPGASVIGRQVEYEERADGIWAQGQLDRHKRYRKEVDRLIEEGALGYSSGAMPHLTRVRKSTGIIERWPWVELSLTPIPAHPGAMVHYTKSAAFVRHMEEAGADMPLAAIKAMAEWDDIRDAIPDPESLDDKAGRVSAAVAEFRDHARASAEMRTKAGRILSAANRERIAKAVSSREAVMAAYADLEALLAETDPEAAKAARSLDVALAIEAEYAAFVGVAV